MGRVMLTLIVWWTTILLESVILVRCVKNKVLRDYPFFIAYLACVLVSSASGYVVYQVRFSLYQYWYWAWEFVCVIAGYGVVLEILEKALESYPGPRRFARNVGLLVLASVVGFTTVQWALEHGASSLLTSLEVERNLRSAESVLLAVIVGVVFYYGVPIGKNLKGIALGYGFCVATVVIGFAARSYLGPSFHTMFSAISTYSYTASLLIWTLALWSRYPNPRPEASAQLEADYDSLAKWTRTVLGRMRGRFGKAAGS
jgi:hypothetical protein